MTDELDDRDGPLDLRRVDAVSAEAGQTFDAGEGRIFPCESCGADLEFHIGQQKMSCQFCGFVKEIELSEEAVLKEQDFDAMLAQIQQWREKSQTTDVQSDAEGDSERRELRCDSCGGNVEFIGTLTSTHCPYCGSPVQLESAHKCEGRRIPVDGVLPFQIERDHARANLKQWVNSRWFAPNTFRKQGAQGKCNGVYLSFFTFDAMTFTAYHGSRGDHYHVTVGSGKNKRQQQRTRWTPTSGRFQRFFDDVLVLANTGLCRDFMLRLEPWPLDQAVPFNQQMLAGYLARTYDIELAACFKEGRERIDAAIHLEVRQRIGGDTQRINSVDSHYEAITFKHFLLPVWLLAYAYRGKTYQVFINAATGEVQGERPWSPVKIVLAILGGLLIAGGVWALFGQ
jgi:DNA-directed RNA polymerase subunit RPC12/RpoP